MVYSTGLLRRGLFRWAARNRCRERDGGGVVYRHLHAGLLGETGNGAAQDVQLRGSRGFEIDEEARFHARRQPLDHAQHPRYLILGERDPPGARYGHDLADRALEQPPAERMSAARGTPCATSCSAVSTPFKNGTTVAPWRATCRTTGAMSLKE